MLVPRHESVSFWGPPFITPRVADMETSFWYRDLTLPLPSFSSEAVPASPHSLCKSAGVCLVPHTLRTSIKRCGNMFNPDSCHCIPPIAQWQYSGRSLARSLVLMARSEAASILVLGQHCTATYIDQVFHQVDRLHLIWCSVILWDR